MNILKIISAIEALGPEVYTRPDSRRHVVKHLSRVGRQLATTAVPLVVAAAARQAHAQTPANTAATNILNFALKLEYLALYFYQSFVGAGGAASSLAFSSVNAAALRQIATDEANHVRLLQQTLGAAAVPDPGRAAFDFSARGVLPNWATDAGTFLALAQLLKDLGVRTYKGVMPLPSLMGNKDLLTTTLNLHSVEARHAAHIRSMRRGGSFVSASTPTLSLPGSLGSSPKSWISGTDDGGPFPGKIDKIYRKGNNIGAPAGVTFEAEDATTQLGVGLTSLNVPPSAASALSEAFDEGLDMTTVAGIANQFSVAGNYFD